MTDSYRIHAIGPTTVLCLHVWFGSSTGWGENCVMRQSEGR